MNTRRPLAVLALVLGLLPSSAHAQVSDIDRATARTLGEEGHDALDQKDYATAADRFTRAEAIVHAPTLTLGLAEAQVGLGKLVTARETYNRLIREGLPPSPPPAFVRALDAARKEVEALGVRIPFVIIRVKGPAAASAKVTVDGIAVPSAALGVKRPVNPGQHVLRAVAEGLASEVTVTVGEGKTETVTLELAPRAKPPPPPVVTAPLAPPPAPPVAPPPEPSPDQGPGGRRLAEYVTGGVGVAGLLLGAVTGGLTLGKKSVINAHCGIGGDPIACDPTGLSAASSASTLGVVSDVGFVVGGAALVTAVVLRVTEPRRAPAAAGKVRPSVRWAGREGATIGLEGAW